MRYTAPRTIGAFMSQNPKPFFGKKSDPSQNAFDNQKPFFGKKENPNKNAFEDIKPFFGKSDTPAPTKKNKNKRIKRAFQWMKEKAEERNIQKNEKQKTKKPVKEKRQVDPSSSPVSHASQDQMQIVTDTQKEVLQIYKNIFEMTETQIYQKK